MDVGNGVVDKAAIRACARQSFDKLELQLNAAIEKQCQELSGKMEVNHCIKYTVIQYVESISVCIVCLLVQHIF